MDSEETKNLPVLAEETKPTRPTTREGRELVKRGYRSSKRLHRRARKIISSKQWYQSVETIISNPDHPHFVRITELLIRYGGIKEPVEAPEDSDEETRPLAPTALAPLTYRKEIVREIYSEGGELVKRFGKRETRVVTPVPRKPQGEVQDAEYTIEEASSGEGDTQRAEA